MAGLISERLEAVFGHKALPDGLFYCFNYALRLELGGEEGSGTHRFLRAVDRARAVVRAVFVRPDTIDVVFACVAPAPPTRDDARMLPALRRAGFRPRFRALERLPLEDPDAKFWGDLGTPLYRYLWTARPGAAMADIDALIWNCCARDMGIEPRADLDVFLIDYARGLAIHIYDDRGMDLVAMKRETLAEYYRAFGPWLLDYDRARMEAVFAD